MTIIKPSVGATGWNTAVDAVIDAYNTLDPDTDGVIDATTVGATRVTVAGTYTPTLAVDPAAVTPADIGAQPVSSELTTMAGLTHPNDTLLQTNAGAWSARTPAQVKTTLALTKGDVGLASVDNTTDLAKPLSTAVQAALAALPVRAANTTVSGAAVGKVLSVAAVSPLTFTLTAPATGGSGGGSGALAATSSDSMSGSNTTTYIGRTTDAALGGSAATIVGSSTDTALAITSNTLRRGATSSSQFAGLSMASADQSVSAKLIALPSIGNVFLNVRRQSTGASNSYRAQISANGAVDLHQATSAGFTGLGVGGTVAAGQTVEIRVVADLVGLYIGGTLMGEVAGGSHATAAGYAGLSVTSDAAGFQLDDIVWSAITSSAAPAAVTSVNGRSGAVTGVAETTDLTAHTSSTSNPHAVTKTQVGLGNVDNTTDAAKPVSAAVQAALDALPVRAGNTTVTSPAVGKVLTVSGTSPLTFALTTPTAGGTGSAPTTLAATSSDSMSGSDTSTYVGRTTDAALGGSGAQILGSSSDTALGIVSNTLRRGATVASQFAGLSMSNPDQSVSAKVTALPTAGSVFVNVRRQALAASNSYRAQISSNGAVDLHQATSSGFTYMGVGTSISAGNTVEIRVVGDTVGLYKNGTLVGEVAGGSHATTAGYGGVAVTGDAAGFQIDDIVWSAVTSSAAVTSVNGRSGAVTGLAEASALSAHTTDTANPHGVTKAQVGLGNVDNTTDLAKPVSSAMQTALDLKLTEASAPELIRDTIAAAIVAGTNVTVTPNDGADTITISATAGGTVTSVTAADGTITIGGTTAAPTVAVGTGIPQSKVTNLVSDLAAKQPLDSDLTTIAALDSGITGALASDGSGWIRKTYAQLKSALALAKADVGLGNVDNTTDVAKPVSTAVQAALDALPVRAANTTVSGAAVGKVLSVAAVSPLTFALTDTASSNQQLALLSSDTMSGSDASTYVDRVTDAALGGTARQIVASSTSAVLAITSGTLRHGATAATQFAGLAMPHADQSVSMKVTALPTVGSIFVGIRRETLAASNSYRAQIATNGAVDLQRSTSGGATATGIGTTITAGQTVEVRAIGDTVGLYKNGTLVGEVAGGSHATTAGYGGVTVTSDATGFQIDDVVWKAVATAVTSVNGRSGAVTGLAEASAVTALTPSAGAYLAVSGTSTAAPPAGAVRAFPMTLGGPGTADRIGIEVTASAASSAVAIGIYASDPTTGLPGALLLDAGSVDTTTSGFKEITISRALTAGVIWLATLPLGGAPTVRVVAGSAAPVPAFNQSELSTASVALSRSGLSGLPTPFGTSGITSAANVTRVHLRCA